MAKWDISGILQDYTLSFIVGHKPTTDTEVLSTVPPIPKNDFTINMHPVSATYPPEQSKDQYNTLKVCFP